MHISLLVLLLPSESACGDSTATAVTVGGPVGAPAARFNGGRSYKGRFDRDGAARTVGSIQFGPGSVGNFDFDRDS